MTHEQHQRSARSSSSRQGQQAENRASPVIPIVAVAMVVLLLIGVIVSARSAQPGVAAGPGEVSVAVSTMEPMSTRPIPYPEVRRITLKETMDKQDLGLVVLVDVRSKSSYDKAHAAGALSVPEDELLDRIDELPRDKELVLYCI